LQGVLAGQIRGSRIKKLDVVETVGLKRKGNGENEPRHKKYPEGERKTWTATKAEGAWKERKSGGLKSFFIPGLGKEKIHAAAPFRDEKMGGVEGNPFQLRVSWGERANLV